MTTTSLTIENRYVKFTLMVLVVHLGANVAHTVTHLEIPVILDPAPTAIILLSHYLLPIIGGALLWRGSVKLGAALLFLSMAASFSLQVYLHFVVSNPDNVASIPVGPWQAPFQLTAVALVVIEALGGILSGLLWIRRGHSGDDLPQSGRIEGVPDSGFRPLTRLTYWFSRHWFGDIAEPLTVMAHHGSILAGTNAFEMSLDHADQVDNPLKELAMVKAAMLVGCEFCIDFGSAEAAKLGITKDQLRALSHFEESIVFSELERLVLRYSVAMTVTPTDVPDELFDELAREFTETELVELTAAIAFENYRGRFNHAFGMGAQGFSEGDFCPRPEMPPTHRESRT